MPTLPDMIGRCACGTTSEKAVASKSLPLSECTDSTTWRWGWVGDGAYDTRSREESAGAAPAARAEFKLITPCLTNAAPSAANIRNGAKSVARKFGTDLANGFDFGLGFRASHRPCQRHRCASSSVPRSCFDCSRPFSSWPSHH